MSKMASHGPFKNLKHKLCAKEGPRVKLAIWLPATKSRESTRPRCVQVEWDTPLESSRGELQVCVRPHPDRRSKQGVMNYQSPGSPNRDSFSTPTWESRESKSGQFRHNFGTPTWESRDKKSFGCGPRGVAQSILYGGRWWLPPSPGRGESSESRVARDLS
jgi:hypothetical protein